MGLCVVRWDKGGTELEEDYTLRKREWISSIRDWIFVFCQKGVTRVEFISDRWHIGYVSSTKRSPD
jgi:hypothetical protein